MKKNAWALVVLALMTAGCTDNRNNSSSGRFAEPSHSRRQILAAAAFPDEQSDDDFDLLEENDWGLLPEANEPAHKISDPLKPLNRVIYQFNDKFYFWILRPTARAYKSVVAKPVRICVSNFFHNLTTPARYANCLLQGRPQAAGTELKRFAINTTVGVLGIGDPAKDKYGLEPFEEDLGQTLATHGVGNGIYIVLPILGPSTVRDAVGLFGDQFLNPVRYVKPWQTSYAISAGDIVNERSLKIGEYEGIVESAIEPYIALRNVYLQYREDQIEK